MLKLCSKEQKRRSAKFKTEVVLSLLCGESAEELSRKHGVTMADIAQWRDEFIAYGTQGFKKNPEDSKPPGLFAVRKGLEPSRCARSACSPNPPVKPDGLTSPLGNGGRGFSSPYSPSVQNKKALDNNPRLFCGAEGTRTLDLRNYMSYRYLVIFSF